MKIRDEKICGGPATGGVWYEPYYSFSEPSEAKDHALYSAMVRAYGQPVEAARAAATEWTRRYPAGRESRTGSKGWALSADRKAAEILAAK